MSPRDLAYAALDFINVGTLTAANTRQKERIARDITATMQSIYSLNPAIYKDRRGGYVKAPATITLNATKESTILGSVTGTPVDGSTILITGDATYNEIRYDGSNYSLVIPYAGETGAKTATVWYNSILIPSDVDRVTGNVMLNETIPLTKKVNRADAAAISWPETDYGRRLRVRPTQHYAAQPQAYWVEPRFKTPAPATHESKLWLRLYPLPNNVYQVSYDVRLRAPRITTEMLGTDGADSTASLVVASDMIESIVLPLFLKRWSGSPWWRNAEALKQINEDATEARQLLRQFRPQQQSNRRMVAPL